MHVLPAKKLETANRFQYFVHYFSHLEKSENALAPSTKVNVFSFLHIRILFCVKELFQ